MRPRGTTLLLLAAIAIAPDVARADPLETCVTAVDKGQAARRRNALRDARASFIECARDTCPAPIRADCTRWLEDVDARMPSVSLRVTSDSGADLAATVSVDGLASANEPGRALALDPGTHMFRAEAQGYEGAEQKVVLVEGERLRIVTITLKASTPAPRPPPITEPVPPLRVEEPAPEKKTSPIVWALGGVGVVGLAGFGVFGLVGHSQASDLKDGCGTTRTCDPANVDAAKTKYLIADVSLGVGIAALGAAAIVWLVTR